MATATANFALGLEDGISASSESAEKALTSLQTQIDKDAKALTQMKKAMRQMQAGGSVDVGAYRKLKGEIDATQNSIGKARASFINLGGDFGKVGKKTSKMKVAPKVDPPKGMGDMLSVLENLPGPLGKVITGIGALTSGATGLAVAMSIVSAAVVGVIALTAALVAVTVAFTAATIKATEALLKYAAAQADALRSERLRLQGLGTLRRWMRLTGKDAEQMSTSISRVSSRVPLARSKVAELGQELHRLGIRGRGAEAALEAVSLAQAAQGDLGARRIMMFVRQVRNSEGALTDLANRVRKELGGVAGMQMRALTMISTKLGEAFHQLFSGVNIEPLLTGLFELSQMFTQNTQTGRALKEVIEALLEPLIGELGGATPAMKRFFEDLVIAALEFAITLTDVEIAIYRAFGNRVLSRLLDAVYASESYSISLSMLRLSLDYLVVGLELLAKAFVITLIGIEGLVVRFGRGVKAGKKFWSTMRSIGLFLRNLDWIDAGKNMIDGIVAGITDGMARLRAAVTGVATDAMSTFRTALGIHSPSTVFAQFGLAIPQGVAEGVERGSAEATGAVGDLLSTTTNNVASAQGGPSRAMTTGDIHIHIGGDGEGAEDTARRVTDALREFFDTGLATETV